MKQLFHGISTSLSHISAYRILENIRLALAEKLMRSPLGYVLSETAGKLKSVIIEYTEGIQVIKAFNQSTDSYQKYADSVKNKNFVRIREREEGWQIKQIND